MITSEEFSRFLSSRRSTRDFKSTPIPQNVLDQILTDALTAPSWSNTRPFKVAVASGEIRDRISVEFLSRWGVLSKIMRKGYLNKLRIVYSRYGLPTSNRSIAKPYPSELKPRAERVGKELYELFLASLDVHGFTAVESGNIVRVVMNRDARQFAIPTENSIKDRDDLYITQVIPLKNTSAAKILAAHPADRQTLLALASLLHPTTAAPPVAVRDEIHDIVHRPDDESVVIDQRDRVVSLELVRVQSYKVGHLSANVLR